MRPVQGGRQPGLRLALKRKGIYDRKEAEQGRWGDCDEITRVKMS